MKTKDLSFEFGGYRFRLIPAPFPESLRGIPAFAYADGPRVDVFNNADGTIPENRLMAASFHIMGAILESVGTAPAVWVYTRGRARLANRRQALAIDAMLNQKTV